MTDLEQTARAHTLLTAASILCAAVLAVALGTVAVKGLSNIAYEVRASR